MANLSQEVNLIIGIVAFFLLIGAGFLLLIFVYRKKQSQYIFEKNQIKVAFEKELLEAQLEVREQTMRYIAQEIHDNIGGTLSLARLTLARIDLQKQDGATEKITDTKELVGKAITDLRTLSKTLHAEAVLSAGLANAIEMELKLIDKTGVFKTSLAVNGTPAELNPQKELILFRTVQEALNNAIKHSGANKIGIELSYTSDLLKLTVEDNGSGFNPVLEEANPVKGSGLRNMKNRTKLIGGHLAIAAITPGTKIQITLPNTTS